MIASHHVLHSKWQDDHRLLISCGQTLLPTVEKQASSSFPLFIPVHSWLLLLVDSPFVPVISFFSLAPNINFLKQEADRGTRRCRLPLAGSRLRLLPQCPTLIRPTEALRCTDAASCLCMVFNQHHTMRFQGHSLCTSILAHRHSPSNDPQNSSYLHVVNRKY